MMPPHRRSGCSIRSRHAAARSPRCARASAPPRPPPASVRAEPAAIAGGLATGPAAGQACASAPRRPGTSRGGSLPPKRRRLSPPASAAAPAGSGGTTGAVPTARSAASRPSAVSHTSVLSTPRDAGPAPEDTMSGLRTRSARAGPGATRICMRGMRDWLDVLLATMARGRGGSCRRSARRADRRAVDGRGRDARRSRQRCGDAVRRRRRRVRAQALDVVPRAESARRPRRVVVGWLAPCRGGVP